PMAKVEDLRRASQVRDQKERSATAHRRHDRGGLVHREVLSMNVENQREAEKRDAALDEHPCLGEVLDARDVYQTLVCAGHTYARRSISDADSSSCSVRRTSSKRAIRSSGRVRCFSAPRKSCKTRPSYIMIRRSPSAVAWCMEWVTISVVRRSRAITS